MFSFEYAGQSTETIISTPLILVSTESLGNITGSSRSKVEGNITISRPITNEYGTTHDPLSFTYSLMKQDFEPFTEQEQITVERWLTSPKLSSELLITDCDYNVYSYFGLFLSTEWVIGCGGYIMCTFTFQVNGRHAYRYVQATASAILPDPNSISSTGEEDQFYLRINCETDELEEYVYPKFEVTALGRSYNSSVTIQGLNEDSNNNSISITTQKYSTIVIDSQHCRIGEYVQGINNRYNVKLFKFKEIGLDDVGNVYWPRLKPGMNEFFITGFVSVRASFRIPVKKVGGWLI